MILFLKFSFVVTSIVTLVLLELIIGIPVLYILWTLLVVGIPSLLIFFISNRRVPFVTYVSLGAPVLLFIIASVFFLIFLEQPIYRHFFILFVSLISGLLVQNVYIFVREPHRYQPYALENIAGYINMLTLFLFLAGVYNLILLLSVSVWLLLPIVLVVIFILTLQTLWIQKTPARKGVAYGVALGVGGAQVFLATSFLPATPMVLAIVTTLMYYFFMSVTRDFLTDKIEARSVQRYALFTSVLLVIVIITSAWK